MSSINKVDLAVSQLLFQIVKTSLESLNKGDILQGRVLSLENSMLLIKLLNGSTFTAKVPENFYVSKNDLITLEIGDRQNGQLTAKVISISKGHDSDNFSEIPFSSDIVTSVNRQGPVANIDKTLVGIIVQKLASYGVQPSEKTVVDVINLLNINPDLDADQASFIAANRLKPNPEMLNIVQKISEHEFQLNDNLQSLRNEIIKGFSEIEGETRNKLIKPLIIRQELDDLLQSLNRELSENPSRLKESIIKNVREILTRTLLDEMPKVQESFEGIQLKNIEYLLKNAFNTMKSGSSANEAVADPTGVIENILEIVHRALEDIHTKTEKLEFPDEKEIDLILDKLFAKAYIKSDNGLSDKTDIKEKTEALRDIMEFSRNVLGQLGTKNHDTAIQAYKEVDQAFRLFSQVTTYDFMVQLPLIINGESTTGELYVMKRKGKRKAFNAGNFTLFLSLKTSGLGYIEAFLNSSNKCVTISFRVEKDELVKLVKENYRALYDGLLKKGYKLAELKCRVMEKDKAGILDAEQKAQEFLGLQSKIDLKI